MDDIIIYTDGSCLYNPGNGGWAAIIIKNGKEKVISGNEKFTTNNRMELMAVIKALEEIKKPSEMALYTDSSYVINAFELGWLVKWQNNNWKNSDKKPVSNKDLWLKLLELTDFHKVQFRKVKAHDSNLYNNRCDLLAKTEAARLN